MGIACLLATALAACTIWCCRLTVYRDVDESVPLVAPGRLDEGDDE